MTRTDTASRLVPASQEQVFAALVDEDARATWLPPTGMTARFERFDPRPGGGYRLVLTYDEDRGQGKSGSDTDVVAVRFVTIEPPSRVVEESEFDSDDPALAGTMTITWSVQPAATGAVVTVTADDVPDGISVEDHAAGLGSSLENLAAYVAQRHR